MSYLSSCSFIMAGVGLIPVSKAVPLAGLLKNPSIRMDVDPSLNRMVDASIAQPTTNDQFPQYGQSEVFPMDTFFNHLLNVI